jgi:hypothetical protein
MYRWEGDSEWIELTRDFRSSSKLPGLADRIEFMESSADTDVETPAAGVIIAEEFSWSEKEDIERFKWTIRRLPLQIRT